MADYDIFISCKSEDYEIAEKVYSFLTSKGFSVFLSLKELSRMAETDYMRSISKALNTSHSMIVVSSKNEYFDSKWVNFEWTTFLNEILSERKNGQIMTLTDNIKVSELPIELRKYQSFTLENYEDILPYLVNKKKHAESLAKEEAARRAREEAERKRIAKDDAKYKDFRENGKYGFKKDGVVVIPAKYDSALSFHEGLAGVKLNGKWGYIDKIGNEVIHLNYEWVGHFRESLARVELNGKYGYIDRLGNEVIPIKYEGAESFSEGLAAVKLNGKYGYIDKTGKEVIPFKYDYTLSFSEELAPVKLNDKWGYIDKTDKVVIPFMYENAQGYGEGLAAVKLNDKWGFIDKTDKVVIPFKYKDANHFSEGLAPVRFIDKNYYKKLVASFLFPSLVYSVYSSIMLMGIWGYIDKTDKVVIPFKYLIAEPFSEGRAKVAKLNFKRGTIDKQGNFTPD